MHASAARSSCCFAEKIEECLGRPRQHDFHAPRTIDLDILYYDNLHFALPSLTLPHPRIQDRPFVLCPLADIRPSLVLPGWERTIAKHLGTFPAATLPQPVGAF
jgi:2-amino-4-hydroxy-6-hydroxymethyldihydropteridine diphosphokinase